MSPTLPCHCGSNRVYWKFSDDYQAIVFGCDACGALGKPGTSEDQARQFWNSMVVRMKEEKRG